MPGTIIRTGFTLHDMTTQRGSLADPYGISGAWIGTSGTAGGLNLANILGTDLHVFCRDLVGSFRYRVDGGACGRRILSPKPECAAAWIVSTVEYGEAVCPGVWHGPVNGQDVRESQRS